LAHSGKGFERSGSRLKWGIGCQGPREGWNDVWTAIDFTTVAPGYQFTLAIAGNGDLYAWGANDLGQLGVRSDTDQYLPVLSL
jgi:alpha-tubulin suppressor-like RCC1 family protein